MIEPRWAWTPHRRDRRGAHFATLQEAMAVALAQATRLSSVVRPWSRTNVIALTSSREIAPHLAAWSTATQPC